MSRKIITILIVLMGISILGIIVVQLVWIDNAVKVRNELFDRSVSEAMHQTVNRLGAIHDVRIIQRLGIPDTLAPRNRHFFTSSVAGIALSGKGNKSAKGNNTEIEVHVRSDSGKTVSWQSYSYSDGEKVIHKDSVTDRGKTKIVLWGDDSLKRFSTVITRGKAALDSIALAFDSEDAFRKGMDQRIHIRAANLRDMAEKARSEIIMLDEPKIDRLRLEQIMKEELTARNIPINFEYAVFKDSDLMLGSEKPDTLALLSAPFSTNLFPDNIFRRNIRLSLLFPSRDRFLLSSIGWLLGASFLFSLVILVAFAASVFLLLRQKKISEMKADFINNMTHEFKTPIATISVASDSILNDKVIGNKEKITYFTGMIKKENQRMNKQVEDILTIARLEKKEFGFRWEDVDLHEIITEVSDAIRIQVEQREGRILAVYEATMSIIRADRQHISNVVFNLLDNANKYSPGPPDITIKTCSRGHEVVMMVTDKGQGMTRQVQSRIFERFYRQPSGNIHNIKGFGLGLNYAKAVVEAHKGTISVHSEPGQGSSFKIILPCKNGNGS